MNTNVVCYARVLITLAVAVGIGRSIALYSIGDYNRSEARSKVEVFYRPVFEKKKRAYKLGVPLTSGLPCVTDC